MTRIPDDKREAIASDIRAGKPRNKIAREHRVSSGSVTNIARELGLTSAFNRAAAKIATAARAEDMATKRAEMAGDTLTAAGKLLKRLDELAAEATDVRDVAIGYGIAVDKHMALARFDSDDGAKDAASLVRALAAGLNVAAEQLGGGEDADRSGSSAAEPQADHLDR